MKGGFIVDAVSWGRVELGLKNIAFLVPDHAARTMRRVAQRIVNKAKDYVPEDTAALRDSIRLDAIRGNFGRLEITVIVGGQQIVNAEGRSIDLDQYAAIVHEAYENMLVYGPGERTLEKMEQFPGKVGSRFLTRAAEEEAKTLDRALIEGITKIIKSEV